MADAGGIAQSFRAWSDRFAADKKGEKYDNYLLPGLDFSREQLFFIGLFCRNAELICELTRIPRQLTRKAGLATSSLQRQSSALGPILIRLQTIEVRLERTGRSDSSLIFALSSHRTAV